MAKATAKQRREWQERVTAMPTRADIDRCKECWPKDWEDKCAFRNGQVATLLAEVERQHADNERLRAREAALLELARAVADSQLSIEPDGRGSLILPPDQINHQVQNQARATLASADDERSGGDGG